MGHSQLLARQVGPFLYVKARVCSDLNGEELVKAFLEAWGLQLVIFGLHCHRWDRQLARALLVAPLRIFEAGLKIVTHHAETRRFCQGDVSGTLACQHVGVIDHKRLAGSQAGLEKNLFAAAGFEHVEIDAQVRARKPLLVKGRFAAGRNTNEDNRFQG